MAARGPSVWFQKEVTIGSKKRGCHLIDDDISKQFPEIKKIDVGLLHIHIKHTSASLVLNETLCHVLSLETTADFACIIVRKWERDPEYLAVIRNCLTYCICQNWDSDVRVDMEMMLNKIAPEGAGYRHSCEGPDDMPAHVKAALIGSSVTIPITDGRLNLGTWQGIWLLEHRNRAGSRQLVATLQGALKQGHI